MTNKIIPHLPSGRRRKLSAEFLFLVTRNLGIASWLNSITLKEFRHSARGFERSELPWAMSRNSFIKSVICVGVAIMVMLVDVNVDVGLRFEKSLPSGVAQVALIYVDRR